MGQLRQIFLNNKLYFKNLFFTYFSQGITAITLIILTPLLTKHMGLHEFGLYGVILNVIAFSVIFDFGLNTGLLRKFILGEQSNEALIKSLFSFFLLLGIIIFPVYIFIFHRIINNLSYTSLIFISILSTIVIIQNIIILFFDTLIQSLNFIYVSKLFRSIKLICEFIATICLLHQINLPLLLLITSSINILYIIVLYVYTQKNNNVKLKIQSIDWGLLFEHFTYSIWYFLASLASVLVFNTQIVIINYLIGGAEAARFLIVTRFFDIIRIAMTNFTQVLTPKIIYIEVENNWPKIKKLFISVLSRISALTLILSICLYFFGAFIFEKWSKLNDYSTLTLFKVYILFIALIIIDNVSFIFLSALKLNKTTTIVSIIQGSLTLLLTLFFVTNYGIIGAIYASLLSFTITNMLFNPLYLMKALNNKLV
jgi:O-antigen/teichoic acid export membrane protein